MNKSVLWIFLISTMILFSAWGCSSDVEMIKNGQYTYKTVKNDPLKARIYTLDNGLKVYLSVYKNAPIIYTAFAIQTGSKKDPANLTGMAHYLEHLLFKGTDEYGTMDWEKEKVEIEKITDLFEVYRSTDNEAQREVIYHQIDSISYVASQYAIPNEYDKMIASIGGKGTNAFTGKEETVYINDIPANQVDNWLKIEKERFADPVFRLFHTELEIVYEEKNMGLDNDARKVNEAKMAGLFQKHSYGTQTTIGTIEHLKNPSLKSVMEYFHTYYVPNNMAILLSGDFDPDEMIEKIDAVFGSVPSKKVPEFIPAVEAPIEAPIVKEVLGPDAESITIAFRFPGDNNPDADLLTLTDMILSNSQAGLIDLNLNQKQKVLGGTCYPNIMQDYSVHTFAARARKGQSLEEVRDLLLEQIELVKKGEFSDWLPEAIINDFKLSNIRQLESNSSRVFAMADAFIRDIPWENEVNELQRLRKISKTDIINFTNKYYKDNYVIIYKRTGEDKAVQKVTKPEITPVQANRNAQSPFVTNILTAPVKDIQPVFLDYKNEITSGKMKDVDILYRQNRENDLFSLFYIADMGTDNDRRLGLALGYLNYLGTSKYTPEEIKQEFYKIGCSFSVRSGSDEIYVSLSGLTENMDKGMQLFEHLLMDARPNPEALQNLILDILKGRQNNKLSKRTILWRAMMNYGTYGPKSAYTNILSEKELNSISPDELVELIKSITSYKHKIIFYGPTDLPSLTEKLEKEHAVPANWLSPPPAVKYDQIETKKNKILFVNYDMKQAEILMLSKKGNYRPELAPVRNLFNEYYGGNMSSIVFQEMRETKALAYSVFAAYRSPAKLDRSEYLLAYIGTQADKTSDAMTAFMGLLNNMTESSKSFELAQKAIIKKIQTERITKSSILFSFLAIQKLGIEYDIRKNVYEQVPELTLSDVDNFFNENIKGSAYNIMILGDLKNINKRALKKYGKARVLSLEEIFGY